MTAHKCNAPAGQYISHCDGAGAGVNAGRVDAKSLCPDSSCTIDTRKPSSRAQIFEKIGRIGIASFKRGFCFRWYQS